uniref:Uncharacterized protein n=1 Tax=Phytophthora fragariae TaxID=53985 RepID=A0A6A3FJT6_9STRA|nr:hypothetical protein PF009_g5716 [Phytophthora fragariae]
MTCIACKMCVVNKNCNCNMEVMDGTTLRLLRMLCAIIKIEIGAETHKDHCMRHGVHKNNLTTVDTCVRRPTTSSNVDTRVGLSPHAISKSVGDCRCVRATSKREMKPTDASVAAHLRHLAETLAQEGHLRHEPH